MPLLDVSFMTEDPMLADSFTVQRRDDVVGQNGRTTPTITETFEGVVGVITQQDPADLMRNDDGQMIRRQIFVASKFRFRGPTAGHQADLIIYQGDTFTITHVLSYSRFGAGTVEVIAVSMTAVDPAQT